MRAICESCCQPQPSDWRPGDLCVHCGLAARQQVRCYWCTHWIPAGNFCRHCGAEGIDPDQYAPARMMKFYGADMFSIPKMLREMDPDRVGTFRSIYGQHLSVAMRHIEELRELEQELFSQNWSGPFEEELIPQLPWHEAEFTLYSAPACGQQSPFPLIRKLSTIVALRRGDFRLLPQVGGLLGAGSEIEYEAALQLLNWRVAGNTYLEGLRYRALDALRAVEQTPLVVITRAYCGSEEGTVTEDFLTSEDPEVSFMAALILRHPPILRQALSSANPLKQMVAANRLVRSGHADSVEEFFAHGADPDQQEELVGSILYAKHPVRSLHSALFEIVERHRGTRLGRTAATAICLGATHSEALRLAQFLDWDILHSLSLSKALEPETFRAIGELMVRENMVAQSQYAWTCLADPTRMPQDFVERVFSWAQTPEAQSELLRFAERQLDVLPGIPRGTSMERVLVHAAFGDHAASVIGDAWAALHRINYQRDYGSPSPFPYTIENITQFWTLPEFEERLARLQSNEAALNEIFVAEELRRFLGSRPIA